MSVTTPPTITAAPTPAPQRGDRTTFFTRVDAFIIWLTNAVAQFNAIVANAYSNAVDSATSATNAALSALSASNSATAALATANATLWVSGASVTQYANVISPSNGQTYRRLTATGSGTTDPKLDGTNYTQISGAVVAGLTYLDKGNSGTTAQVVDNSVADVQRITVTGIFSLTITNLPSTRIGQGRIDLVNGGAFNFTYGTTINWLKSDGTYTTSFAASGYTLQTSGRDSIIYWNDIPGGSICARVMR